jgi:tetratricopeptide (TPR) repeat protein
LTWLSLQLDATLYGPQSAWGFHLTNLLLHAAVVVLFFLVLLRMTGSLWHSAIAAALFAIHPLRVESVAWVTERKDMLSTVFLILTVGAYQRYTESPTWGRYGLVFLCFCLGLMAKPSLVTLPFALLLLDYWPLFRLRLGQEIPVSVISRPAASWRRVLAEKVPLLILALVTSQVTLHFASQVGAVKSQVPWGQRLMVAASGYLGYLENTVWPANLAVLYPFQVPSLGRVASAVGLLSAITLGVLYVRRQSPALMVGWFWFLGTLFPVSGVIQVGPQALADRYTYVPHLGLSIMVVWGVGDLAVWCNRSRTARTALLALVLLGLGGLTWMQVWYWQDSETLFTHTLSVTEKNHEIHRSLAGWWFERGDPERANHHMVQALEMSPNNFELRLFYGVTLTALEANEDAVAQLRSAVQLNPANPDAHYLLGMSLAKLGYPGEAREQLQKSVACWASNPRTTPGLGDLASRRAMPHLWLGEIALQQGDADEATRHFADCLKIKPDLAEAHQLTGVALGRLDRWHEAEASLVTAIDLDPENSESRGYLAFTYARQGKRDHAARDYADLLLRKPDWPSRCSERALKSITQARFLDHVLAKELALQACEATDFKDARWLDTLAAVKAASADFVGARQTAKQALDLASDPALIRQIQDRLHLYEQDKALPLAQDKK